MTAPEYAPLVDERAQELYTEDATERGSSVTWHDLPSVRQHPYLQAAQTELAYWLDRLQPVFKAEQQQTLEGLDEHVDDNWGSSGEAALEYVKSVLAS